MSKTVVLRDTRDQLGTRYLGATLAANGDVIIEGQDLGAGVEEFFGEGLREYEYVITVRGAEIPALLQALGTETDVLMALQKRFGNGVKTDLATLLKAQNIPYDFWSRIGD
jgi:hypothetical protein